MGSNESHEELNSEEPDAADQALWGEVRALCLDTSTEEYDVTAVSDALVRVIERVGDDKLPDCVAAAVEEGIFTLDEGTLLIGVASYSTSDEGYRIQRVLERWLENGSDERRIAMALDHDTVPFRSRERRRVVLMAIAARFPQFASKCRYFVEQYPGQEPAGDDLRAMTRPHGYPELKAGMVAVVLCEGLTGIVLSTALVRATGEGENKYFVFDAVDAAIAFAREMSTDHPLLECTVLDSQGHPLETFSNGAALAAATKKQPESRPWWRRLLRG
jgi:hypothetical protein